MRTGLADRYTSIRVWLTFTFMSIIHHSKSALAAVERRPEVPTYLPSLPVSSSSTERSAPIYADAKTPPQTFKSWKAGAEGFSWKLFAISQALSDKLMESPQRRAADVFHTFASKVIQEKQWKRVHGMTLWSNLPEGFKKKWEEAEKNARAHQRSPSPCSATATPRFTRDISCDNGQWAYFTFQAAAGPSSTSVVHNGIQAPGKSRKKLPVLQRKRKTRAPAQAPRLCEDPNPDCASLPAPNVVRSADTSTTRGSIQTTPTLQDLGSFVGPFGFTQQGSQDVGISNFLKAPASDYLDTVSESTQHLSNFEDIVAELGAPSQTNAANAPSPTLGLATGLVEGAPSFDFRQIFPSIDYKTRPPRDSSLSPSLEKTGFINTYDEEEESYISFHAAVAVQPARKRRRLNPEGDANPSDCIPLHHPLTPSPSPKPLSETPGIFDDLLGLDVSTWPTVMPKSQLQTIFDDVPFTGGEHGEQVSQHDGVRSNSAPRSLVEATVASSSALQYALAATTIYEPRFDLGLDDSCTTTPESCVEPQSITPISMLESGLSDVDSSLLLEHPIPEISLEDYLSAAGYLSSPPSEHQEDTGTQASTYDSFADFQW